jgi:hypothetical protein
MLHLYNKDHARIGQGLNTLFNKVVLKDSGMEMISSLGKVWTVPPTSFWFQE